METIVGSLSKEYVGDHYTLRTDDEGSISIVPPVAGLPYQYFLTTAGDGTGDINHNHNHVSPEDIYFEAQGRMDIYTLLIAIDDNAKFLQTGFGGGAALTNGIKILTILPDATEVFLLSTSANPIKTNAAWAHTTPNIKLINFDGTSDTLIVEFAAAIEYGKPFPLVAGQKFVMRLSDDLSGLTGFTAGIRGIKYY